MCNYTCTCIYTLVAALYSPTTMYIPFATTIPSSPFLLSLPSSLPPSLLSLLSLPSSPSHPLPPSLLSLPPLPPLLSLLSLPPLSPSLPLWCTYAGSMAVGMTMRVIWPAVMAVWSRWPRSWQIWHLSLLRSQGQKLKQGCFCSCHVSLPLFQQAVVEESGPNWLTNSSAANFTASAATISDVLYCFLVRTDCHLFQQVLTLSKAKELSESSSVCACIHVPVHVCTHTYCTCACVTLENS